MKAKYRTKKTGIRYYQLNVLVTRDQRIAVDRRARSNRQSISTFLRGVLTDFLADGREVCEAGTR
jgi:hypothetical protein